MENQYQLQQPPRNLPEAVPPKLPDWLRYLAIALLLLGIFFRFYNLNHKVYWLDETYTSLRTSGYTREEFVDRVFTGKVISVAALQHYQYPTIEKNLTDTLKSIAIEEPQLTPLYFVLAKLWLQGFGDSVTVIRSLSAVISLFAFPCLWWLCQELFQNPMPGWMAIALVAVTPLHLLYAQEARPYSLWVVMTLLSSAVLLWAMRTKTRLGWAAYGLILALGLYTHLLFGAVAVAQGLYVAMTERVVGQTIQTRTLSKLFLGYLLAALAALLSLTPWLILLSQGIDRVDGMSAFVPDRHTLSYLIDRWFVNINRAFLGEELYSANFVLVLLSLYALYFLCRHTPRRVWLFVLLLIGIPFLALALPDLILGGGRSLRIRYLMSAYLGIQIAIAYLFATQIGDAKTWAQKRWRIGLSVLLVSSIFACAVISQAQLWWNKGVDRSAYYLPVALLINQFTKPLVIQDTDPMEVLGLSDRLDADVKFQLSTHPKTLEVATGFDSVFLVNPSQQLQSNLIRQGYDLTLVYEEPDKNGDDKDYLWRAKKG